MRSLCHVAQVSTPVPRASSACYSKSFPPLPHTLLNICTYPTKLFNIQHNPSVHPTVVSPLRTPQFKIMSRLNFLPATSAENKINTVADKYHITCRRKICVRIFKGGSSVIAPARGGRRRRAMLLVGGVVYL